MITLTQKGVSLESDLDTPISLFLDKIGFEDSGILLESAEVGGRWGRHSLIGAGVILKAFCQDGFLKVETETKELMPLKNHEGLPFMLGLKRLMENLTILSDPDFKDLPPITRALYGYLGYGVISLIEAKLSKLIEKDSVEAVFILPKNIYLFDHIYRKLWKLTLDGVKMESTVRPVEPKGPDNLRISPSQEEHRELVIKSKELITQGELIQLVLSVSFDEPFSGNSIELYRTLRSLNPSPYMFHLQLPEISLIASSPEVLVSSDKNVLKLCPIAGTRPRGQSESEDNLFEVELSQNIKEQSEHVMLVDLGRNDLGKVATAGSVVVERYMDVERFSHVMHLTSQIKAILRAGLDGVDVISGVFPAGTVTGAPKIRAMELIAEMENSTRGPYAGGLGWFGLDKDGVFLDFGITIRASWIRDGRAHYRAGGGLVYDSEPESEWRECLNKAQAIKEALKILRARNINNGRD
ncbi:MAG: anthranilate synthase component I family protein [Deltaproteobacteria bacterium]|jgi:anthranilate synthase component 1|nr:anthranilate synthase component I family protein [Deltaproteobacteria bacterium]